MPVKFKVPPLRTRGEVIPRRSANEMAAEKSSFKAPLEIVMPPDCILVPVSVNIPVPSLVKSVGEILTAHDRSAYFKFANTRNIHYFTTY